MTPQKQSNVISAQQCFDELCMRLPDWIIFVTDQFAQFAENQMHHMFHASGIFYRENKSPLYFHLENKNLDELCTLAHHKALKELEKPT